MARNDEERMGWKQDESAEEERDNGFVAPADDDVSSLVNSDTEEPKSFATRLADLEETVTKHPLNREILYKILTYCANERLLRDVEDYIATLPEFPRATQNQYHMIQTLVRAGGLEFIERDEQGVPITSERKEGLSEDEVDDLVFSLSYVTTDLGSTFVEQHRPQARLVELLNLAPERTDTYLELLEYVGSAPRSYADVKELLDGSPALETLIDGKRHTMQPSVFVDKLERAGALVWKDGWNLTEEGREFLEELKDEQVNANK